MSHINKRKFKVGDTVIITVPSKDSETGPGWNGDMTKMIGKIGKVMSVNGPHYGVKSSSGSTWSYLEDWILPYSEHHLKVAKFLKKVRKRPHFGEYD